MQTQKGHQETKDNILNEPIAIISMSCSLPGAPDVAAFQTLLEQGLSGVKEIPL
ncbi:beta-ketoacyl synthase N-terminal-like domain-containing protein, partial [Legionella parisiensis]|uniref:beta-ketoacyl synthase N-terminal-like domain-containing protein n=1 Tax=Legionella parisiensis TaxID=45071 RepID=UPI001056551E